MNENKYTESKNFRRRSDSKISSKNVAGFARCGLRNDYVEGTGTSPVGYLEGIYVEKEYRLNGLLNAATTAGLIILME